MVPAHWEDSPLRLGRTTNHWQFLYDFGGFPERRRHPGAQFSLPHDLSDAELYGLGRTLAPLRDEEVVILGSGNVVHNTTRRRTPVPPDYAHRFDSWVAATLSAGDFEGAAGSGTVTFPLQGFEHGTSSLPCVQVA